MSDFQEFPKIARLSRECIVTEKLDGTNAQVLIAPFDSMTWQPDTSLAIAGDPNTRLCMWAGSRTKWITPADDNYGFARWAQEHAQELFKLGPGRHFGEWWGQGIQRKYGLTEKRFSLFNAMRWCGHDAIPLPIPSLDPRAEPKFQQHAPSVCHIVPVLARGTFSTEMVETALARLREIGSVAAPGFMKPEGVVVYHTAGNVGFKKTLEKDELPKGRTA